MIGRRTRERGRHRAGRPYVAVHRRLWDGPARSAAERLDNAYQRWSVLYSLGERRFYALVALPLPEPLIIADDTAEGLERRIREVEAVIVRCAPSVPPSFPDGCGGSAPQTFVADFRTRAVAPGGFRHPWWEAA